MINQSITNNYINIVILKRSDAIGMVQDQIINNLKGKIIFNKIMPHGNLTVEDKVVIENENKNNTKMLAGKHALITGATSGIGKAAVQIFSREGAKVIAIGNNLFYTIYK